MTVGRWYKCKKCGGKIVTHRITALGFDRKQGPFYPREYTEPHFTYPVPHNLPWLELRDLLGGPQTQEFERTDLESSLDVEIYSTDAEFLETRDKSKPKNPIFTGACVWRGRPYSSTADR